EELGIGRIGAGIAAFHVVDAEIVEQRGDLELVLHREVDAVHLRAVAQRGVEEIEPFFHGFTFQVVVPSLWSSSSTPISATSLRMRSDSLKFLFFRAALLAASSDSIIVTSSFAAVMVSDFLVDAGLPSNPTSIADDFRYRCVSPSLRSPNMLTA